MFLHQFINSDFYKLLNSQLFAACIGAFVTIAGVWLTIYNDRKSRRVERKNEIKRPPVSNVDHLIIVMSAVEPDFSTQLLDRFLVIAHSYHMRPRILVTKKDLTKKLNIAGTGTIEADGSIGEIGEVEYKLLGAVRGGADVFLVPAGDNYKTCKKVAKEDNLDIEIIPVKTIEEAIEKLEEL